MKKKIVCHSLSRLHQSLVRDTPLCKIMDLRYLPPIRDNSDLLLNSIRDLLQLVLRIFVSQQDFRLVKTAIEVTAVAKVKTSVIEKVFSAQVALILTKLFQGNLH